MSSISSTYFIQVKSKIKRLLCFFLMIMIFMNTFGSSISLVMFYIHFDDHLEECQHHRKHGKNCQATCILSDIMPEHNEVVADHTHSSIRFLSAVFFQHDAKNFLASFKIKLLINLLGYHFKKYSSPSLGILAPPPKFLRDHTPTQNH